MKNILIITYWSYNEALIQAYTLPYVRIIKKQLPSASLVFLVTLEKDRGWLAKNKESVTKQLEEEGLRWIPLHYKPFGWAALFMWIRSGMHLHGIIRKNKIDVIHCWCTPAGAVGYILSMVTGKKLVIDSYEPHAEAMVENGTWKKNSIAFKLLFWLEKKQTQKAEFIIAATKGMREYAQEKYGVAIKNYFVKPACVDLSLFSLTKKKDQVLINQLNLADKITCVYAGKFGGIYLESEIFDMFKAAYDFWGDQFRVLLLTDFSREEINAHCVRVKIPNSIITNRFVAHREIPFYMGLADFAICPVKPLPSKRYCTPIKNGEYWAMGLPVIIPLNISDDSEIIESNNAGAVLYELNEQTYQSAIEKIDKIIKEPNEERTKRIRLLALTYRDFSVAEKVYKSLANVFEKQMQ
ncbi:MAG: glycosyltransferase [Bacteroidetes bacterium]|nr:glycosyltransferase [Bacteroidota bacterium]